MIVIATGLLIVGLHGNRGRGNLSKLGFDKFGQDPATTGQYIGFNGLPVIAAVLIANSPQLLVSLCYFLLNSNITTMLMNAEWTSFAHKRKPLRVSSPTGQQRPSYYLQLPYRFSVPLLITMATLHWGISQSIFLSRMVISEDEHSARPNKNSSNMVGFSSSALLFSTLLGLAIVSLTVGIGRLLHYPPGILLLGNCSLVISAACHPRPDDECVELSPLQWGVISTNERGVSHCGFASSDVRMPVEGEICA